MKPTTRAVRRGLAALALTSAAVVIPTTALAASGGPAKPALAAPRQHGPRRPYSPRCGTGALTAWLGIPGDGFAGGVNYQLELSNTSGRTCTLYGFPGVSALGPRRPSARPRGRP